MTGAEPGTSDSETSAPVTGEDAVDRAMSDLSTLSSAPVSEHHDRLTQAHEALHRALHPDLDTAR